MADGLLEDLDYVMDESRVQLAELEMSIQEAIGNGDDEAVEHCRKQLVEIAERHGIDLTCPSMKPWAKLNDNQRNLETEVWVFGVKRLSEFQMRQEANNVWMVQPACQCFLMGFSVLYLNGGCPTFVQNRRNFTEEANHDYSVLEKVRSEWDKPSQERFGRELQTIWLSRSQDDIPDYRRCVLYRPGDYANAAYETIRLTAR